MEAMVGGTESVSFLQVFNYREGSCGASFAEDGVVTFCRTDRAGEAVASRRILDSDADLTMILAAQCQEENRAEVV